MKTANICNTKPHKTKPGLRCLLRHPDRKGIGRILQLVGLYRATVLPNHGMCIWNYVVRHKALAFCQRFTGLGNVAVNGSVNTVLHTTTFYDHDHQHH